nr:MAG: polyprotein [Avian associated picorna-like virus 38]
MSVLQTGFAHDFVLSQKVRQVPSKFNLINVPTVGGWAQVRRQKILNKNSLKRNIKVRNFKIYNYVNKSLVEQRKAELEKIRGMGVVNLTLFQDSLKLSTHLIFKFNNNNSPLTVYYKEPVRETKFVWEDSFSTVTKSGPCFPSLSAISISPRKVIKPTLPKQVSEGCYWDIRHLFRLPRKNYFIFKKFNEGFSIGLLNGKPLYGPISRAEYHRRAQFVLAKRQNFYLNKMLSRPLTKKDYINFIYYCKPQPKSPGLISATSVKQVKPNKPVFVTPQMQMRDFNSYVPVGIPASRSPTLLFKLRSLISECRLARLKSFVNNLFKRIRGVANKVLQRPVIDPAYCAACHYFDSRYECTCSNGVSSELISLIPKRPIYVDPQMDKEGEGSLSVKCSQDVTTIEQREEDVERGPIFPERSWNMLTTTEADKSDERFANREILLKTFNWNIGDTLHKNLLKINCPRDVISSLKRNPIALLFKQHRYWTGHMEFSLQINANRVMLGALMMSWYYCAEQDSYSFVSSDNVFSISQRYHSVCIAGSSNPMVLSVPYAFIYPYMSTVKRTTDESILGMGELNINVLVPLRATSNSDIKASCALYVKFVDSVFTGMVDNSIAGAQMNVWASALAISAAEQFLVSSFADQNRDNPPGLAQPVPMQNVQAGNFSYGTGILEPLSSLRLNPRGQTPHPGLNRSEMEINEMTRVFGLIGQMQWSNQYVAGKVIGIFMASPIFDRVSYPSRSLTVNRVFENFRIIPPVAFVSTLFKQWRGTLEFKFEFVANFFYSGSILVAYIPGVLTPVSIDVAKSSSYVIFDLKEINSFTYICPFIYDKPWCPSYYSMPRGTTYDPPGSVQIFVVNPLALNDLVPDNISINVYLRGGIDFEVSVPVQPRISICRYPYVVEPDDQEVKALDGYFPYYVGVTRYFYDDKYALLRYGAVLDHVAYFSNIKLPVSKHYYKYSGPDAPFLRKKDGDKWVVSADKAQWAVGVKDPGNDNYWLALVRTEADCISLCTAAFNKLPYEQYFIEYPNDDADAYYSNGNSYWIEMLAARTGSLELVRGQGARDDAPNPILCTNLIPPTGFGFLSFGESFSNVTSLLRRYQYYDYLLLANGATVRFSLDFSGMPSFSGMMDADAYAGREGLIALFASGYRFFRGGMRLKLVETTGKVGLVEIQHHADNGDIQIITSAAKHIHSQGYSAYIQKTDLNPIITIEIPYYLDSMVGFLGCPPTTYSGDFSRNCHLGQLRIINLSNSMLEFNVYNALADDARFDIFQGFPPVRFVEKIVNPQMEGEAQGSVLAPFKKHDEAMTEVKDATIEVRSFVSKADGLFEKFIQAKDNISNYFTKDKFISIISQFAHMLASPHIPTIAIGIATIFLHLFSFEFSWLDKISTSVGNYLQSLWQDEQTNATIVDGQADCGADREFELIGVLASVVAAIGSVSLLKVSDTKMGSLKKLFIDANIYSRGLNGIINLIGIMCRTVGALIKHYLLRRNGIPDVHLLLKDQGVEMYTWGSRVENLLDPTRLSENELLATFPEDVFDCLLHGQLYAAQVAACGGHNQAANYIRGLVERLRRLQAELHQRGRHPFTRITPFSFWGAGPPGVGKSTLGTRLMKHCLDKVGFKPKGMFFYKIEPGATHWDNVRPNHAFLLIDDAFCLKNETFMAEQLASFFNVVTNAPFTPRMAHLENKNLCIAPLGLVTFSNAAYPQSNCMAEPEAFYRRRHCMWNIDFSPKFSKEKFPEFHEGGVLRVDKLPADCGKPDDFPWLQFRKYRDPRDCNKAEDLEDPVDFKKFLDSVAAEFERHYKSELVAFKSRVDMICGHVEEALDPVLEVTPTQVKQTLYDRYTVKLKDQFKSVGDWFIANENLWNKKKDQNLAMYLSRLPSRPVEPNIDKNSDFFKTLDKEAVEAYEALLHFEAETTVYDRASATRKAINSAVVSDQLKTLLGEKFDASKLNMWLKPPKFDETFLSFRDSLFNIVYNGAPLKKDEIAHMQEACNSIIYRSQRRRHTCCEHVCDCRTYVQYDDKEYMVPTCANCLKLNAPVLEYICGGCGACDRVIAHSTDSKRGAYLRALWKLCKGVCHKIFKFTCNLSKDIAKASVSGVWWIAKKACKLMWSVILPLLGAFGIGITISNMFVGPQATGHAVGSGIRHVSNFASSSKQRLVSLFTRDGREILVPEGNVYAGATNTRGSGKLVNRELVIKQIKPQGCEALPINMQISDTISMLERNTYCLGVDYEIGGSPSYMKTEILFIRGRQALIVKHCWDEIRTCAKYRNGILKLIKLPSLILEIDVDKIVAHEFMESNFVVIEFTAQVPEHKKIVKHFLTQGQHKLVTTRGKLVHITDRTFIHDINMKFVDELITVRPTPNSSSVTMLGCYKYDIGGPGFCGSLILCLDTHPAIIGMHVAGIGGKVGYCEPIVREMFEDVPVKDNNIVDIVLPKFNSLDEAYMNIDGKFLQLGVVDAQFAHHETGISKIVPSLCHGIFDVKTAPAPLSRFDFRLPERIHPMFSGVEKLGQPIRGFPIDLLDFGEESLLSYLRQRVTPVIPIEPVSLNDAICGRSGIAGFSPLNFNTSEGYPLSSFRPAGVSNKKWLFDLDLCADGYQLKGINQTLKDILTIKQCQRENGIKPFSPFVDCLKDARIPIQKCSIPGKTRVFSISPVDYSIQFRQYFMPYLLAHQNSRGVSSSAVGINVLGPEWSELCFDMKNFTQYHACGDYSNFGSGFCAEVHDRIRKCLLEWFKYHGASEKDNRVRSVLLSELVNSLHLCFNVIYQVSCGMPSGSPITVETNDNVNYFYILMAWREIMGCTTYNTYYYFCKYVKVKTYGDDIWLAIHEFVIHLFNNVTLHEFFAKYGVKYTDASKSGDIVPYRSFSEVSFLKRQPVDHPDRPFMFLAQLELDPALDIANWCWESKDHKAATLVNLEACSDALYGHGKSIHAYYRRLLMTEANRLGYVGNFRSWEDLDRLYLTNPGDLVGLNLPTKGLVTPLLSLKS